ncbi:MAG: ORF6N domain-containing protein [Clostridia bacterium]|nr:ORF6N domain-containing protein [Clostridia bacterium]
MNEKNNIAPINEELKVVKYETENIKKLIYTVRGKQVMLDSDVAMLYHYETKKINQTVKRNIERFPEKFCFQLTEGELKSMWSQFVTTSKLEDNKYRSKKYLPYVFTEQGIAMLSGLLRNEIAVQVSINIMDAFVEMRKFIASNGQVFQEISSIKGKLLEYDKKFDEVFNELQKNKEAEFKQKIFFNGQIYDAYSLIIDIIKRAKSKILIIDNYIDDSILKMLSKKNKDVEVVILTSQNCNLTKLDIQKFNKQYPTLKLAITNKFHDRFIVIDNKELYHCGASLKDLGKKCFAISKIEDMEYVEKISNT